MYTLSICSVDPMHYDHLSNMLLVLIVLSSHEWCKFWPFLQAAEAWSGFVFCDTLHSMLCSFYCSYLFYSISDQQNDKNVIYKLYKIEFIQRKNFPQNKNIRSGQKLCLTRSITPGILLTNSLPCPLWCLQFTKFSFINNRKKQNKKTNNI